jgi:glycosyltransferase involved in cell wall biosynthesis
VKCRLLYLVGQLGAGGLERQICFLLTALDRDRYRPEVVVWNFHEDDTYVRHLRKLGVPLHGFPGSFNRAKKLLAFRQLVLEMKPDVLHSYTFYTNFAAWWAALGTQTIAVGAVRSDLRNDRRACGFVLGRLSARWPAAQIYNNSSSMEKAQRLHSFFAPERIFIVRNGLDLTQFPNVPISKNGQIRILGVGSLLQIKRWDRLLTATKLLKGEGLDFLVQIAGAGPLRDSLEKQAQALEISEQVRFSGHEENIPGLLAASTLLAHTSDVEGCPNVVMEAMACGRPVVATDAGDTRYLIDEGQTGFVVRRGDDAQLVERLATLIRNRDLCRLMGEAGRIKAEREFGLSRLVEETLTGYQAAGWKNF